MQGNDVPSMMLSSQAMPTFSRARVTTGQTSLKYFSRYWKEQTRDVLCQVFLPMQGSTSSRKLANLGEERREGAFLQQRPRHVLGLPLLSLFTAF